MVKRCSWGTCNSDSRYPERLEGAFFIPFPKPKANLEKCMLWIKLCCRPHWQLNPAKITKDIYVCSKHFIDGKPTAEHPHPVDAGGSVVKYRPLLKNRCEYKDPNPGSRVCSCHFVGGKRKNDPHLLKSNAHKSQIFSVPSQEEMPKGREVLSQVTVKKTHDDDRTSAPETVESDSKPAQLFPERSEALLSNVKTEKTKEELTPVEIQVPLGLMGPVTGMSPDKKAQTPGVKVERAGLRGTFGTGTPPEAESATSPRATSLNGTGMGMAEGVAEGVAEGGTEGGTEDEELTDLNWLHENLLQNFTLGGADPHPLFCAGEGRGSPRALSPSPSPSPSDSPPSSAPLRVRGREKGSLKSKPPFSFSLLIYMAIEQSPGKSLPVKDIYGWILQQFPYFNSAPAGWKNSVRHNLSLNKCFRKVDRSLGKASGKGSLWCVDPKYRPNLLQALKKQHLPPGHALCTGHSSPPSASSPPHHLLLRDQCCSDKDAEDSPMDLSQRDLVIVSRDPKQDHTYSSSPQQCSSSHSSPSSLSSLDDVGRAPPQACRAGSAGLHSDEDCDPGEETGVGAAKRGARGHLRRRPCPTAGPPRKRAWPELDEELKEAAGSLLHLAGIRTAPEASKRGVRGKTRGRK
ncbi:forkhead box protein N2b isoform X2 [Megalops cyprinoides]|uniref:forkhead box protein N2b isoform X2 n=1 Tax=Megalops cyprinoides TaxID=118141 RepID=UPI001863D613|nr:forkhead box protein N2b isoform X2 [Megalops cyprinoides]